MTKPLSLWRVVEALRHDFLQLSASLMSISSDMLLSFCLPGSESAAPLLLLPTNQPLPLSSIIHMPLPSPPLPRVLLPQSYPLLKDFILLLVLSPQPVDIPSGSLFLKSLFEHLSLILNIQSLTSASRLSHFLTFHSMSQPQPGFCLYQTAL